MNTTIAEYTPFFKGDKNIINVEYHKVSTNFKRLEKCRWQSIINHVRVQYLKNIKNPKSSEI